MESLLRIAARRAFGLAVSFVVLFLIVLVAFVFIVPAWEEHAGDVRELMGLRTARSDASAFRDRAVSASAARVEALKATSMEALDARIAAIDTELSSLGPAVDIGALRSLAAATEALQRELERNVQRAVLRAERDVLLEIRAYRAGPAVLEAQRQWHAAADAAVAAADRALAAHVAAYPLLARVPLTRPHRELDQLTKARDASKAEAERAREAFARQERANAVRQLPENALARLEQAGKDASARVDTRIGELDRSWGGKAAAAVPKVSFIAAGILLAAVLTPIAIKALFYFVLAPLAGRWPPIELVPEAAGRVEGLPEAQDRARISSVSLPLSLAPTQVLLVQPDFLQSSAAGARIDTRWLLDWRYPFASLAAGMYALTRIRSGGEGVVISSTRDPLSEVGLLGLPEGTSFVLQPRSLAAVIHPVARPLRISSRWRFWSLHAWLTLQLRYLVFHGPADLIVKGSRGVRVERPGDGRRINQAATIGFSANLRYRTSRCETFASYLFGQRELLQDSFEGDGYYAYQEIPESGRGGLLGRGLTGLAETLLKIVGI